MWRRPALFLLLSCLAQGQNPVSPLWQRYFAASHEARDAQAWKIDRNLIAIVPGAKGLVWKKAPDGAPMVKVVGQAPKSTLNRSRPQKSTAIDFFPAAE